MRNEESKDTVKYDCFAYKKNLDNPEKIGECIALNKLYCKYEDCSFYKTEQRDGAEPAQAIRAPGHVAGMNFNATK